MPIKTFRGLIADGAQDIVSLHTNTGTTGYQIKKFQLMHNEPGQQHAEHTVKIYTVSQSTINNAVDFADNTLLAAGYIFDNPDNAYPVGNVIVFDNMIFNQDIYITHEDTVGTRAVNYYIELEQVKLDLQATTVATLKDIRNVATTSI